ncbi:RNA polymerase sigma factor [Puteibacter caeruleilacunae]|nr:RNA polymerase sigma factor [Puteibacter caeruleilacunae]
MFAPRMFGVCYRYSATREEAEDNLQDSFIKIFEKIDSYGYKGAFEGWMRRVVVNVCLAKFRNQNQALAIEDLENVEVESLPEDKMDALSEQELLTIIQELPPRYRMVFNLYVVEEYSHKEIATELNISEGTSKSNLARARMIVKSKVNEQLRLKGEANQFSA